MFTGIVEDVGRVAAVRPRGGGREVVIAPRRLDAASLAEGESIAVNGCCLTVETASAEGFTVFASHETLARTNLGRVKVGDELNLERSVAVGGRLGGHIVNGHVDGVGRVSSVRRVGGSVELRIALPPGLSRYVVEKGSVAVDGVSLTVNEVRGDEFTVNIIPYTQDVTTLSRLREGDVVNIECDILAKYVERLLGRGGEGGGGDEVLSQLLEKL